MDSSEGAASQPKDCVWLQVIVFFLSDGMISYYEFVVDPKAAELESGDLESLDRDGTSETAVVLGHGDSKKAAMKRARAYYRRLAKWDGVEDAEDRAVYLFGYDLSQSQLASTNDDSD